MYDFTRITATVLSLKGKTLNLGVDSITKQATALARQAIEKTIHITQEELKETELHQLSISIANATLTLAIELATAVGTAINNPDALEEAAHYTNPHREAFDQKLEKGMTSGLYRVEGDDPQATLDRCVLLCVVELTTFYGRAIAAEIRKQAYH